VDENGWLAGCKWMDIQIDPFTSNLFTSLLQALSAAITVEVVARWYPFIFVS
jgi:hypothetical protein